MKPGLLPPLPVENYVDKNGLWDEKFGPYSAEEMQSYAALAVREALERAAQKCEQQDYAEDCANAIRALAKEYE